MSERTKHVYAIDLPILMHLDRLYFCCMWLLSASLSGPSRKDFVSSFSFSLLFCEARPSIANSKRTTSVHFDELIHI